MKYFTVLLLIMQFAVLNTHAQISINDDGSLAHPSAILDVKGVSGGFLLPRLTQVQIESVTDPATGLLVFNLDDGQIYFFNPAIVSWNAIAVGSDVIVPVVTNPATGETWMDRNLGALTIADSSNHYDAYGDLYQWGRLSDGHEDRSSGSTSTQSASDIPGHNNFIITSFWPQDWRNPGNDNLWQGLNGSNNPCPDGFRIPTEAEWTAERASWVSDNAAGAYNSPLKLSMGGFRYYTTGNLVAEGTAGNYWASTIDGPVSRSFNIAAGSAGLYSDGRAEGFSIRCIKD